jgi:hypothetical protein
MTVSVTRARRLCRAVVHVVVAALRGAGAVGMPLILLHGARVPGLASFDLAVPDGSLAEELALAGHRVFVMHARGVYAVQRKPVAAGRGASGLAGRPPGGSSSL